VRDGGNQSISLLARATLALCRGLGAGPLRPRRGDEASNQDRDAGKQRKIDHIAETGDRGRTERGPEEHVVGYDGDDCRKRSASHRLRTCRA